MVSATCTMKESLKTLGFQLIIGEIMRKTFKGHHCVYDIHYHIVFPVKYRKALLNNAITKQIKDIAIEIGERYEIRYEQIGCDGDHIHLLCGTHPKYAPGAIVRIFKSITAKQLFKTHPELKKELWGGEFWSDGYFIASVGTGGNWSIVERYVKGQGKSLDQLKLL